MQNNKICLKARGFTLIEMAVVLLIVGLLIGGVMKGSELIENAEVNSVIQDYDNIHSAYYAFIDRTDNPPGDANNDGIAEANATFWQNLRAERFIDGLAANGIGPQHAFNGLYILQAAAGAAANGVFTVPSLCATNIPSRIAQIIDNKLDDGSPDTGEFRSANDAGLGTGAYASDAALIIMCKQL